MASNRDGYALQLDMLPQELLIRTIAYLDIDSLKSIRLCCKIFQHMPNKELFQTFYLYPHETRFKELLALSRTELSIRGSVQSLVYDLAWANFDELLTHQRDSKGPPGPQLQTWWKDALVKAENETTIQSSLACAFPFLPSLTSIRVIDLLHPFSKEHRRRWSLSMAPGFYQRLMPQKSGALPSPSNSMFVDYPSAQHFQPASVASCILHAASLSNVSLSEVKLEGIATTDILGRTPIEHIPHTYGGLLANVEMLCINFGCIPRRRERAALARLPVLLAQCTNLCYLSLEFGALGRDYADFDSIHPYTRTSIMDDLFPNTALEDRRLIHSRNLRMLDLRGFRCKERDYASIVGEIFRMPCPNFIGLFLTDLTVLPQEEYLRRACLVDLIKLLRNMQLLIVQLSGTLTNCGNQKWVLVPTSGENTLYDKVHDYMLWQGDYGKRDAECPLQFTAVQQGEWDVDVPTEDTEENQKWKGDESWQMDNRHRQGEGGIWVPVDMMLYFDAGDTSASQH